MTLSDGIGHTHAQRRGRGGRSGFRRQGRQEEAALGAYGEPALDSYGSGELTGRDAELAALSANIPGVPGEDYPIYAEVPESDFSCDGQVDGGEMFDLNLRNDLVNFLLLSEFDNKIEIFLKLKTSRIEKQF